MLSRFAASTSIRGSLCSSRSAIGSRFSATTRSRRGQGIRTPLDAPDVGSSHVVSPRAIRRRPPVDQRKQPSNVEEKPGGGPWRNEHVRLTAARSARMRQTNERALLGTNRGWRICVLRMIRLLANRGDLRFGGRRAGQEPQPSRFLTAASYRPPRSRRLVLSGPRCGLAQGKRHPLAHPGSRRSCREWSMSKRDASL